MPSCLRQDPLDSTSSAEQLTVRAATKGKNAFEKSLYKTILLKMIAEKPSEPKAAAAKPAASEAAAAAASKAAAAARPSAAAK
eukprot:5199161-Prymnesium_polylepis.1